MPAISSTYAGFLEHPGAKKHLLRGILLLYSTRSAYSYSTVDTLSPGVQYHMRIIHHCVSAIVVCWRGFIYERVRAKEEIEVASRCYC